MATSSANYQNIPTLGAFHGAEVPFVFGDTFELTSDEEKALSKAMGCYWRSFAHTGDPNRAPPGAFGGRWPALSTRHLAFLRQGTRI